MTFLNRSYGIDISKKNFELLLMIVTIDLFIFRMAIPFFKYLFIFFYLSLLVNFVINNRKKGNFIFSKYIKNNFLPLILLLFLILGIFLSKKYYLLIIKDLGNTVILFSLIVYLFYLISDKYQLKRFLEKFLWIVIGFSAIISIYNLTKTGLKDTDIDYNFALIPIFFGYITTLYFLININSRRIVYNIIFNGLLLCFTCNVFVSSSRRGIFLFLLIFMLLLGIQISSLFSKNRILNKLSLMSRSYIFIIFFGLLSISIIFFKSSYEVKNRFLELAGATNLFDTKKQITVKVNRIYSFINKDISYNDLFEKLWIGNFNPKDPESGWGTRNHKVVYPLSGENVQIVPAGVKGYLLDSTCNASTWDNTNAYSYTKFADVSIKKNQQIIASVFCYVSENFDGTWVRISSEGKSVKNRVKKYNLNRKGIWQKLEIQPECNEGKVPIYLYLAKYGVTDFSTMKGYVIFAYPTYKIINEEDSIIFDSSKGHSQLFLDNSFDYKQKEYSLSTAFVLSLINTSALLNTNNKFKNLVLTNNWIKHITNEDTTYYGYDANISVEYDSNNPMAGRTARWQFAWQIFIKEYNGKQKIFGNGFDYLNWYGDYFLNNKTKSDYPHNPFLSVLLYSGIVGLLLYIYLMFKVVSIYLKYIKEYYILFIFFSITFFFSFFSANGPFSPPIMGFFVLLPFFIDYIHKKDKSI